LLNILVVPKEIKKNLREREMDSLFRDRCKGNAITNLAVACLRRVLTRTASHIVGEHEFLDYSTLKQRIGIVLSPPLARPSLAYAKALARTTRPPAVFPNASKTANIVLYLVLDYLLREMLDLSAFAASGHRRILPRHVRIAMLCDDDLERLVPRRTVLFFPEDDDTQVDPFMGRLGNIKLTTHCLSTKVVRTQGECSLQADDATVRFLQGPLRMYSRLYQNRVVAFLLLVKQGEAWRLDYGFHAKCHAVWKRMVQRLLIRVPTIVVPVVTSDQVRTFLTSIGFEEKKSTLLYNANETQNHEASTDRAVAGRSGVCRHVRGRVRDDHAAGTPGSPRRPAASPDRTPVVPARTGPPARSTTHEGHVPGRNHV
jgi:hypothetical protein